VQTHPQTGGLLFCAFGNFNSEVIRGHTMKVPFNKPATSYTQQVNQLQQRGMEFDDPAGRNRAESVAC
jgi:hypothetical protein